MDLTFWRRSAGWSSAAVAFVLVTASVAVAIAPRFQVPAAVRQPTAEMLDSTLTFEREAFNYPARGTRPFLSIVAVDDALHPRLDEMQIFSIVLERDATKSFALIAERGAANTPATPPQRVRVGQTIGNFTVTAIQRSGLVANVRVSGKVSSQFLPFRIERIDNAAR